MYRIVALNDITDDLEDNAHTNEIQIAKEAQEAIVESEYLRSITLFAKGEKEIAHSLFLELLNTQVLDTVTKEDTKLWAILYNCYKYLAIMNEEKELFNAALAYYISAIHMDNSDTNTLLRFGQLAFKLNHFELAEYAFEACLQQNKRHWAAANGLLKIHIKQNNIVAAYGISLKLIEQKQLLRQVNDTMSDIVQRFSSFLPFCEKMYGKLPADYIITLNEQIVFEATQFEQPAIEPVKCEFELPTSDLQMNFRSIGEFILAKITYLKENNIVLGLLCNLNDICTKTNDNALETNAGLVNKADEHSKNVHTSAVDQMENQFSTDANICDANASNAVVDLFESEAENKSDEDGCKSKTRRRCSDLRLLEQWGWHKNRKSTRRKAQQERPDTDTTLAGFLKEIFFKFLNSNPTFDESEHSNTTRSLDEVECKPCQSLNSGSIEAFNKKTNEDFKTFFNLIKEQRMDFPSLNFLWLKQVSKMWLLNLPNELRSIYIDLYLLHIEFFGLPTWNMLETNEFDDALHIQIFFMELQYDKSIKTQSILPKIWMELYNNLHFLFGCKLKSPKESVDIYTLRILNLEFLKFLASFENEESLRQLDMIIEILNTKPEEFSVHLPNLNSCCITRHNLFKKRMEIERKTKLKQIPMLFKNEQWKELCENLKGQLSNKINNCSDVAGLHDYKNLNELLLQCLWRKNEFEDCLIYAESFLHYSIQNYFQEANSLWINAMSFAISYIEAIIIGESSDIVTVLKENRSRLVQNIINISSYYLDEDLEKKTSSVDEVKIRHAWMILHRLIVHEENNNQSFCQKSAEDDSLPLPFTLLFTAHEYIGRKQACTCDNGEFLQYIIKSVVPNLHAPIYNFCRNHAVEYIEQITFCLYGYPPKKARSRHLEDHNSKQIDLSWDMAIDIFYIYAPETLPEFNSYKVESITSDMEQFLHKILALFPKDFDMSAHIRDVHNYINGLACETASSAAPVSLPFKIKTIYYLMADYYFKSRDFAKAIKYYINDLAVNSSRFDSWAGISLSKASMIETKLNGLNQIDIKQFVLECDEVLRCFEKCIQLMQNHILIWIEYGSFAYCISSFCSRSLKQLNADTSKHVDALKERKERLLNIACNCFTAAAALQSSDITNMESYEEKWLCQYMLGKVAEKRGQHPNIYLSYYLTAATFLYECNATYPIKINHNNPTTLSVEALEVFYRTNAAIIKYLEVNAVVTRPTGNLFKGVLKQLSNSPFAFNKAKIDGNCLYALKRKSIDQTETNINKKPTMPAILRISKDEEQLNSATNQAVPSCRRLSEESRATGTITSSASSLSSFSNYDSDSDNSRSTMEANYSATELDHIYKRVIRNLEECVIRFPEHYKSIYRLVSFFMSNAQKMQDLTKAESLLLHNYKTSVGNIVDGLFFDRKTNNIFNGVWRIPSSEIDRPGSFSSHLVKCVNILIQLLKKQSNYNMLVDIMLQLQKTPDNDKRYILDSDRVRLYEAAVKYCQEIMRCILHKNKIDRNETELLNLLLDIYKIQKKCFKYIMQKNSCFSTIFVEVYLCYMKHKIDTLPSNANYADLAVKLCHHEINHKKHLEKQWRNLPANTNTTNPIDAQTLVSQPTKNVQFPEFPQCNRLNMLNAYITPNLSQVEPHVLGSNLIEPMFQDNNFILEYYKQMLSQANNDTANLDSAIKNANARNQE